MPSPTIFIASSEEARSLVDALARALREEMKSLVVKVWWKSFPPSQITLASLIEACRKSDFAAVFLTTKDRQLGRANCIFEAGMFNGVFGIKGLKELGEARRCFLLTSIPKAELFSDLDGITFQHVDESADSETIPLAASKIIEAIKYLGPVSKPELECYSEAQLLEWERVGDGGNLSRGSEVLINLTRPIEVDEQDLAKIVSRNLQANVHYEYFFSVAEKLRIVAQLFYSVATAEMDSSGGTPDASERSRMIEANLARMQRQLRIWLLSSSRPFEFCIHNADRDTAVCYLRLPADAIERKFINWCSGNKAIEIAKDVKRSFTPPADEDHRVFRRSLDFDLYASDSGIASKRFELEEELRALFDESLYERVREVCFGQPVSPSSPSPVARPKRNK